MLVRLLVAAHDPALAQRIAGLVAGPELLVRVVAAGVDPTAEVRREPCDALVVSMPVARALERVVRPLADLPSAPELIVLSSESDPEAEAALVAAGGLGVLSAEIDDDGLSAALGALVDRVRERHRVLTEISMAESRAPIVAESDEMAALLVRAKRVAAAETPVLILGETGVGKELIANFIHVESHRDGPFIALNCAAIPSELVESELFGHEKGAFTGAHRGRRGYFELAHGGTLFLDELGELPLGVQAKLLRVLQERKLRPVGSDRLVPVDVRVIAATNRDLELEMERGRFRRDLYYRLGVVELEIPPLRDRPRDLEALLHRNLRSLSARFGRTIDGFTPEAKAALLGYAWPGNVRELINVLERAVLLCLSGNIALEDMPRSIVAGARASATLFSREDVEFESADPADGVASGLRIPPAWLDKPWKELRESLLAAGERAYISHLLETHRGRIGDTAKAAGIAERSLFEKMKRHGLRKEDFRSPRSSDD